MAERRAKPPGELGIQGLRLWNSIASEANGLGLTLDPMDLEQMFSACRIKDTIAALEERLSTMDLVVPGSREQWVVNGLVTEIRLHRQLISQTLARLQFPEEEASPFQLSRATQARSAANSRWRG